VAAGVTAARLAGIYPILYAFFDARGALDRAAMRRQTQACLAHGCGGMAILGLATEVNKLSPEEKRTLIDWLAEDVGGRVPLAVTISGATVEEQVALAEYAKARSAAWLILQPPRGGKPGEAECYDFFARVMEKVDLPCAIQNAPEFLGVGLGPESIARLAKERPNFVLLKGEGPAVHIRQVIERAPGLAVFNGRGGLELMDNLRAGCAGMIVAPDTSDYQQRVWQAFERGDEREAEAIYARMLPAVVFIMQSLEHLVCYGKRIAAARLGLGEVHDRAPALAPTAFGLDCVARFARELGPLA
jgi:4-hydroxy-tetrahydrodipicolinate synthase